jgi:hypothetical protein
MNKQDGGDRSEPKRYFRAGSVQVGQTDYILLQGINSYGRVGQMSGEMTGRSNNKLLLSRQEEKFTSRMISRKPGARPKLSAN